MHHIQKAILEKLTYNEVVRFAALRPAKVESNLYSYHLKLLIKDGLVRKTANGYTLGTKGLLYVDHLNQETFTPRPQAKIVIILVLQNKAGDILLIRRAKQPFINKWALPSGKVHFDDESVETAALREAREKLNLNFENIRHVGNHYIKHIREKEIISSILGLVFYAKINGYENPETKWWHKDDVLLPGTEEVITLALQHKTTGWFFEETTTHS